jgi:hypothetical protein
MRVLLTGPESNPGASLDLLADTSIPAAGSSPFGVGSGSIDDTPCPR